MKNAIGYMSTLCLFFSYNAISQQNAIHFCINDSVDARKVILVNQGVKISSRNERSELAEKEILPFAIGAIEGERKGLKNTLGNNLFLNPEFNKNVKIATCNEVKDKDGKWIASLTYDYTLSLVKKSQRSSSYILEVEYKMNLKVDNNCSFQFVGRATSKQKDIIPQEIAERKAIANMLTVSTWSGIRNFAFSSNCQK